MALAFSKIKTKLGLDDVLSFGRHQGYTVEEVIKDRPEYISWLIAEGKQFYQSVHEELAMYKGTYKQARPKKSYIYTGGLRGDMAHFGAEQEAAAQDFDDWFDDIPY